MTSWLKRTQAGIQSAPTTVITPFGSGLAPTQTNARFRDPNAPDVRLDVESKCIYERRLPGNAYITAHVTRLQDGFYDSPSTHGDTIDNVRFLAVSFVFHPSESINRFQSAVVSIALHDDTNQSYTDPSSAFHRLSSAGPPAPKQKPKFLRFAPHVMFGGVSPETLNWNFNLSGSIGVSQTPVSASLSPSGGMKGSYKLYQMMRIQGSTRTLRSQQVSQPTYDIEDGEVVWTMEENPLQKSGLPREMTFVMLITKGDVENVVFDISIEARVASWFGHYPKFWNNMLKYQPLQKEHMDLDCELGQRFEPTVPGRGFNFANLAGTFNDFVSLPGTAYSVTDQAFANHVSVPGAKNTNQTKEAIVNANDLQVAPPRQSLPQSLHQPWTEEFGRSASVPPQQPGHQSQVSQDGSMDYHIFLHNPRSINLHATPPPPSSSAPLAPQSVSLSNPLNASDPISRPQTTLVPPLKSPSANIKTKRRSIDISYIGSSELLSARGSGGVLSPNPRKNSPGSLRRSRSRTDLRSSPLIEDSNSELASTSTSPSTHKEIVRTDQPPEITTKSPSPRPLTDPEDVLIPMEAPSPPGGGGSIKSPPLPSWRNTGGTVTSEKLPFELNRPTRPRPVRSRSGSGSAGRISRSKDSPSPVRPRREITPSPSEEIVDMNLERSPDSIKEEEEEEPLDDNPHSLGDMLNTARRERDISPYAAAALANGVGLAGAAGYEHIDEAKGDLKALRARKRYSLPAQYSYITHGDEAADRDWEER